MLSVETVSYTHLYVSIYDESYPSNLKHIYDAPKILFYKGNLDVLKNNINLAMVGSRTVSYTHLDVYKRQEE